MTGVTPIYHIRYPDDGTKLNNLGPELGDMGASIEAALQAASIPPVTNPQIVAAGSAAARDAYWGVPATEAARLALQNKGAQTVRTDKGWTEQYLATYDASANPQGATTAGWYVVSGRPEPLNTALIVPKAGWTVDAATTASRVGNRVVLSCRLNKSSGINNDDVGAVMPIGWRPGADIRGASIQYGSGSPGGVSVYANGEIHLYTAGIAGMVVSYFIVTYDAIL
jgi:hypothetical protein